MKHVADQFTGCRARVSLAAHRGIQRIGEVDRDRRLVGNDGQIARLGTCHDGQCRVRTRDRADGNEVGPKNSALRIGITVKTIMIDRRDEGVVIA